MSITVHKDVMVAMRDGVELATDVWVPETTPAPTLLVRLPYSKDLPGLLGYALVPNLFALVEAGATSGVGSRERSTAIPSSISSPVMIADSPTTAPPPRFWRV